MNDLNGLYSNEGKPVPLVGVKATATLAGRAARVKIAQRFANGETVPVEAVYKFPLPESAAVCGFRVTAGGRVVEGAVDEREAAFKAYDEALAAGDGGFLLDMERPNVFTLSVGNLEPGREALVELEYVTLLASHGAEERFTLPTTIAPRYVPAGQADEDGRPAAAAVTPEYAAAVPYGLSVAVELLGRAGIAAVESPSHPIRTAFRETGILVEFAADAVAMDRDFTLTVVREAAARSGARAVAGNGETIVALDLALPEAAGGAPAPREVVFLLDCSGSMSGSSIESAKKALELFLKGLEPGATFNVVRFGSTFVPFFDAPRAYDEASLAEALKQLAATGADLGGTEVLAPLQAILARPTEAGRPRAVILVTDGEVSNEDEVLALVRGNRATSRLFVVGIGHGPNEFLVRGLARAGGGSAELIGPAERVDRPILRLFRKVTADPVENLAIAWGDGAIPLAAKPCVFPGEPVTLFARIPGHGVPSALRVRGGTGASAFDLELIVERAPSHASPLPPLYAREAIRLLEEGDGGSGSRQAERKGDADKAKVIELSKKYNVLSRATSFVAIEVRAAGEKTTEPAELRKVPVLLAHDWHGTANGRGGVPLQAPCVAPGLGLIQRLAAPLGGMFNLAAPPPPSPKAPSTKRTRNQAGKRMKFDSAGADCFDACISMSPPREALEADVPDGDALSDDPLVALLSLQRASGGFAFGPPLAALLGLDSKSVAAFLTAHAPVGPESATLLATALVFALFEARYADRRAEWESVTAKSRRWFDRQAAGATSAGKPLAGWAAEFVKAL